MEVEEALEFADVALNATDGRKMTKYTHPDKELELKANYFSNLSSYGRIFCCMKYKWH